MSNQTIDGVPRELLVCAIRYIMRGPAGAERSIDELRALLDAPVAFQTPDCPDCACVQDGQCLCIPSKPAARTQGDPVEWVPTVAQIRYRRPERNCPDFGVWHEFPLKHYDKNRTWFIDNNGWECETRLLFVPVVKP